MKYNLGDETMNESGLKKFHNYPKQLRDTKKLLTKAL